MANNELLTKMNDIISEGLDELSQYAAGTDEFSKALNAVAKLHKLRVDEIHLSQSQKEQENKHDLDKQRLDLDKNRAKDDTTDRTERRKIDEKRFDLDRRKLDLDRDRHVADLNSDAAQREDRRRDRYLTIGIAAAELLIPLGVYTGLALLGFGREFDGVITSDTLKRIWNNIKPTKR